MIQSGPKRLRIKYFGFKILISIPVFITFIVFSAYFISSSLFSWGNFDFDDYEDFVDEPERMDAQIAEYQGIRHNKPKPPQFPNDNPNTLLDIKNFTLIHTVSAPDSFCSPSQGHKLLLVVIKSSRENYASRKLIRKTYVSLRMFQGWIIRHIFLIGTTNNTTIQEYKLRREARHYGDTIVTRLSEEPEDSVYVHLMGYQWIVNHCKTADFILKAMDNIFIDIFQVIENLSLIHTGQNVMLCRKRYPHTKTVNQNVLPITKDFLPEQFPIHCGPEAIIMSFDAFEKIYLAALKSQKVIWDEEVWTTGVLREAVGITAVDIGYKYRFTYRMEIASMDKAAAKGYKNKFNWVFLSLPMLDTVQEDLLKLWNHTLIVNSKVYKFELS